MDGQASWWTSHLSPWGSDEPLQELKKKQETTDATLQEMQKRLDELTEKVQRLGGDGPAAEKGNAGEVEVLMDVEREASARQPEVSKYEMQESIWDATLLLYVGHAATSDMVLLIIGMIVNVAFQLGLLITIQQNMLDVQFDDAKVEEMMEWRVVNGQSFQNFDQALGMSRSQRLCSDKNKLWSFEQSEYDDMYDYLYRPIPGSALSTMAIVLWVLTCMREYRALVEQLMALMHLPVAKIAEDGSSITVEEQETGTTIIAIRPCARIMALLTLTLPRFAVLMVLSFVGCLYLAQTVTLADIVLNAVALAFVLDIDEALCHVLFSQRLRTTMSRVQPISCGGRKCAFAGIAVKDMVRYVWTLAPATAMHLYSAFPVLGLELVHQVKALQRESEHAKRSWHEYCELHGSGVRDPSRHPADFLRHFLDAYHSGALPTPSAVRDQRAVSDDVGDPREVLDHLVAKVKHGQRTSQSWKELWWAYCDSHQDGVRDPGRHDVNSLQTFLEEFAPRVKEGSGDSASSRDRQGSRESGTPSGLPPGSGVSALADRVKQMQRRHESYKERWAWYCDSFGNGIRDPARHTPQFLQQYITMVEGGSHMGTGSAGPYGSTGTAASGWSGYGGYPGYPYGYGYPPMMYPGYGFGPMSLLMYGAAAKQASAKLALKDKPSKGKSDGDRLEQSSDKAAKRKLDAADGAADKDQSEQSSDAGSSEAS